MQGSWHKSADHSAPLLLILSGPSGVGKDAVLSRIKQLNIPFHFVVTMTTRARRSTEVDGVDYRFVSVEEFQSFRERQLLLECANVYGNWYGVPLDDVKRGLEAGRDTLVKVDVQGVDNIKSIMPEAISLFLRPTDKADLQARLKQRRTETAKDFSVRVQAATAELAKMTSFDYIVLNEWGQIDAAVETVKWIAATEKGLPATNRDTSAKKSAG